MAHANNSIITGKFKGILGKEIVFRDWEGKTVVAKAPKRREGEPTPAQAETHNRFQFAARYAKGVMENPDPALREGYATVLRPRQNIYSRALEDFMSPPEVVSIATRQYRGVAGDKITIRAKDDFRVTEVRVEIYAADQTLLESGEATLHTNFVDWAYTATQANSLPAGTTIKAIATDVPGNEGALEVIV